MPTRRLQLPDWVRHRRERESKPHLDLLRKPPPPPPNPGLPAARARARAMRRTFRGIVSAPERRALIKVAQDCHQRHADAADPFRLPQYSHPLARRRAREARR